ALLVAKSSQDYVYAKDYFESADGKTEMIVGCYALPRRTRLEAGQRLPDTGDARGLTTPSGNGSVA
ncbi:hypothetical protein CTI14_49150, partial [Methylobacterium radiotolerans]